MIVFFLLTCIFGYRIMECVDRFLSEHATGEEEADEPENTESA